MKIIRFFTIFFCLGVCSLPIASQVELNDKDDVIQKKSESSLPSKIVVGYQKNLPAVFFIESFAPTLAYLRKVFPKTTFSSQELTAQELLEAAKRGSVHLFFSDSGTFNTVQHSSSNYQLGTVVAPRVKNPNEALGVAVIVRNNSPVRRLKDLKGKKIASESSEIFHPWMVFLSMMKKEGISTEEFAKGSLFTFSGYPDPLSLLQTGAVDAAVVSTCVLEELEENGTLPTGRFRVLQPQNHKNFPCKVTSELFPDTVFAATHALDPSSVKALSVALLTMPATRAKYSWGLANDFLVADEVLRQLEIGHYSYLREINWKVFWEKYSFGVTILLLGVIGFVLHFLRVRKLVEIRTAHLKFALTQKGKSETEAREARERLSAMERAGIVADMSSLVVHELRQPLSAVVSYSGGLEMYLRKTQKGDLTSYELSQKIVLNAQKVSDIVERVRYYAKTGRVQRNDVLLKEILERAAKTFRHTTTASGITLLEAWKEDASLKELTFFVDPLEIELAIVNLLRNGAQAMQSEHIRQKVLVLSASDHKDFISVSVRDFVSPLSDKEIERLSKPVKSFKREGLGLGLTLVHRIMEAHAGHISFSRASDGRGLVATLIFQRKGVSNVKPIS